MAVLMHRSQTFTYYPAKFADFVHIGKDAIVEAAQVGHGVQIGEGAIIVRSRSDPGDGHRSDREC